MQTSKVYDRLMSLLQQLTQHAVRDLYCACFGKNLMASGCNVVSFDEVNIHFPHLEQWFLDLDKTPNTLLDHISSLKSTRLGIYYEALWEYYLRYAGVADLLAKNRQVRRNKQTIGEYDFVYYCRRCQIHIHLETAIKFYIGVQGCDAENQPSKLSSWIGPARRDRLDIKYATLIDRQMRLPTTEEGRESLHELGIDGVSSELALKGMLFYPASVLGMQSPIGSELSHSRGIQLREDELLLLLSEAENSSWVVLERREWCSPFLLSDKDRLLTARALKSFFLNYFSSKEESLVFMPIQIAEMNKDVLWQEKQRYFIVGNDWNKVN